MAFLGSMFLAAAVAYVVWRTYSVFLKRRSLLKHLNTVYMDPFPITHFFRFKKDGEGFFEHLAGVTLAGEKIFHMILGTQVFAVLCGPEEAESILTNTKEITKSFEYRTLEPWLGKGLLTATGPAWRARRKLLTPAFHHDILKDFIPVFNEQSRVLVQQLQDTEAEAVDAYPFVTLCALDIICETAMGKSIDAQKRKDTAYIRSLYRLFDIIHERHKSPWFWPDFLFNAFGRGKEQAACLDVVHGFTGTVIRERGEELDLLHKESPEVNNNGASEERTADAPKKRFVFLDLLLNMKRNGEIDGTGVQEEVDTFMFEGHDTTSAGMTWFLQCVANDPRAQAKIHEEVDKVLGDDTKDVTFEDLKSLVYLEASIKEALRLFPSVPLIARELQNDTKIRDTTVPAGTRLMIFPYAVHRDPAHWPDPHVFKPERFLAENSVGRHPFAYIPFSGGPRNCIGQKFAIMEEKVVLAWVMRHFTLKAAKRTDELHITAELILRPKEGVVVNFIPRTPLVSPPN